MNDILVGEVKSSPKQNPTTLNFEIRISTENFQLLSSLKEELNTIIRKLIASEISIEYFRNSSY